MLAIDVILVLQIITGGTNKARVQQVVSTTDFKTITGLQPLLALVKEKLDARVSYADIVGAVAQAKHIKAAAQANNIHIVVPDDKRFPPVLQTIEAPPTLLFIKGDVSVLASDLAIAVVGTRKVSPFGADMAQTIAQQLALQGVTVISGLALGTDTAAHQGCLSGRGRTIAVLAHGLNMLYPYQNTALAAAIISQGGCLLSEYLPDTRPTKYAFIERDRLQSGLSQGVIVIESTISGGTMHTVRCAQQQGRKLACVKQPPDFLTRYPEYKCNLEGNLALLSKGVVPLDLESLPGFIAQLRSRDELEGAALPRKRICTV